MTDPVAVEWLAHYGVKGQKWGVRKKRTGPSRGQRGYAARKNRKADRIDKRASNQRSYAKNRDAIAKKDRQHLRRITTGKATAMDKLKYYGTVNALDLQTAFSNSSSVKEGYAANRREVLDRYDNVTKGVRNSAAKKNAKATEIRRHTSRVTAGKATTSDKLKYYGKVSLTDIARGG